MFIKIGDWVPGFKHKSVKMDSIGACYHGRLESNIYTDIFSQFNDSDILFKLLFIKLQF